MSFCMLVFEAGVMLHKMNVLLLQKFGLRLFNSLSSFSTVHVNELLR